MQGCRVLDCFTHTGSFALNAGIAGASSVLGVDASQLAVDQARINGELNGLSDRVQFQCADVFDLLPELERQGEQFDVVILDPPAFAKSRASVKNAPGATGTPTPGYEAGAGRRLSGYLFLFPLHDL